MNSSIRICMTFKDRAEEAVNFYVSVFPNSKIKELARVETGGGPIQKGKLLSAIFELDGREFRAFDGGDQFTFTEGFSIDVTCKTQEEIDRYWSKLTAGGGQEVACGWLTDRFGVSWQIIPEQLGRMLTDKEHGNTEAAMNAMLQMKKMDIATLEKAYRGSAVA